MADLVLDWGALGPYGTQVTDTGGISATVDTGGVAVDITYDELVQGAQAFTFDATGYAAAGEAFDPNSHLKLFGDNTLGASDTSTVTFDFRSTSTDLYTDSVQNVSFRLNDVDTGPGGDLFAAGGGFEDIVTVTAYDADGNPVPVSLTPESAVSVTGDTATGGAEGDYDAATGSVLVSIPGPISRIEVAYANGNSAQQAVLISDMLFTTVDVGDPEENDPPTAVDDLISTATDTPVTVTPAANDTDPDGDTLSTTAIGTPSSGSAVLNGDGTVTFTPAPGFTGTATIPYTVSDGDLTDEGTIIVTVGDDGGENRPPVAVNDSVATDIDTAATVFVLGNDADPDDDALTISGNTAPANGAVEQNDDGSFTYTPNAGYVGVDTFTYTITDGEFTSTAEVRVVVGPVNGEPPVAFDDTTTTVEGTSVSLDPTLNDIDPEDEDLTVSGVGPAANGTVTFDGNTVTYTPNAGFIGTDTFTYDVVDPTGLGDTGTVTVTIEEDPNLPPVAVDDDITTDEDTPVTFDPAGNDTDPDSDPLRASEIGTPSEGTATLNPDGTVTYTPPTGFNGTVTIPYTVTDGDLTDEGLITITVGTPADPRIDTDIFPVDPADQALDPFDGLDQDPDPDDDRDDFTGTSGPDTIRTGDDADTIRAGGGDDIVEPGIDNDEVYLGGGNDTLFDVQGADTIYGGSGNDSIIAGTDTFSDYEFDDPSFAPGTPLNNLGFTRDPNPDDGRDYVEGNLGNDYIATGDDADTIDGGGDNDTLDGGIDDDLIMGGQGDDLLIGGHGSDTLDGGQGNDTLDGSAPAGLEIPDATDPQPDNDRDLLQGFLGNDSLIGGDDDDTLEGGSGNDTLDGGIDDDILRGGDDDDILRGGDGNDTLNGGSGVDTIDGGADRDIIFVDSAAHGTGDIVDGGSGGFVADDTPEDGPNNDYDILNLSGVGAQDVDWRLTNVVTDSNGNGIDGTVEFLNGAGEVTGTMNFFEIEEIVPCFTPGTLIATPQGERLVEDLEVGDRVITRDNGIQEIKWVGRKDLTGFDLARKPHFKPILIQQGALGNNLPEHDMLVSPNHRVLVANDKTALYFEEREVLVAAKHLVGLEGVDEVEANGVSYIHVMFEQHEVILSNGAWTESFQPGDYSLKGIGNAQREEILELFPELEHAEGLKAYGSARRSLKKHEAALLTK